MKAKPAGSICKNPFIWLNRIVINIEKRRTGDIRTLVLTGKVLSNAQDKLWHAVQHEVVEEGERQLILDFSGISECDSYGISELLRLHRSIQNIGGKMVLACLNDLLLKVFSITKVDTVFNIAETIPMAMELFPGPDLKPV